jgi:hypothetical protein
VHFNSNGNFLRALIKCNNMHLLGKPSRGKVRRSSSSSSSSSRKILLLLHPPPTAPTPSPPALLRNMLITNCYIIHEVQWRRSYQQSKWCLLDVIAYSPKTSGYIQKVATFSVSHRNTVHSLALMFPNQRSLMIRLPCANSVSRKLVKSSLLGPLRLGHSAWRTRRKC